METPTAGCPKRMVFGPCGGVRDDGRCELAEHPCAFHDVPLVRWPEPAVQPPAPLYAPRVLVDLSVTPFDGASVRRVVDDPASDATTVAVSMAKARAGETAARCAGVAVQLHGGIGYTWEHDLHLYLKRALLDEQLFGSPRWHRERVAALLLDARYGLDLGASL